MEEYLYNNAQSHMGHITSYVINKYKLTPQINNINSICDLKDPKHLCSTTITLILIRFAVAMICISCTKPKPTMNDSLDTISEFPGFSSWLKMSKKTIIENTNKTAFI